MGVKDFFARIKEKREIKKALKEEKKQIAAEPKEKPISLGLALSGGGTRGFAHIGAIKAFEECGIEFKYVAGTSVGSLVGALYCAGCSSDALVEIGNSLKEKDFRSSKFILVPSKSSNLESTLTRFIGDCVFSDLKKPFACVAVDMKTGEEIVLKSGMVARAVSASCAVPGAFTPVLWQDYVLQDGGLSNPIPADVVREMGADIVITVDINSTRGYGTNSIKTLDLLMASLRIAMKQSALKGLACSDVIIQPLLKKFNRTSLDGMQDMIEEGYSAAMAKMGEIKELIEAKKAKM